MRWHDLLFMHWPVSFAELRRLVPEQLELDTWDGQVWLGVVPFHMSAVGPRGLGWIPGVSRFAELNVRTYVRAGGKAGVWFLSLDAESAIAVEVARARFHLPYMHARMRCSEDPSGFIHYESERTDHRAPRGVFRARYRPSRSPRRAPSGSFDEFLTERYCLYAEDTRGRVFRGEVHHHPWPLQPAELELDENTMAAAGGITLPATPPLLHFAKRLDVVAWSLDEVG